MGILAPLGIVEVDGQEVAGVVGQQRIHADGVPPGKVVEDRLVGHRYQRRWPQSPHLIRGFSQMPARHSLAHAGE